VGITPERSGRASTLRAVECEGPGRATACCESGVAPLLQVNACVSVGYWSCICKMDWL
jgi:hypothetical protein